MFSLNCVYKLRNLTEQIDFNPTFKPLNSPRGVLPTYLVIAMFNKTLKSLFTQNQNIPQLKLKIKVSLLINLAITYFLSTAVLISCLLIHKSNLT